MTKKIRFFFRLTIAFVAKHYLFILAGVILSIVIGVLIINYGDRIAPLPKTKIAIVGRYTLSELPDTITSKLSKSITKIDSNFQAINNIASEYESTDAGKIVNISLIPDLYWHDGKKFVSQDVKLKFKDTNTEYKDENTLSFVLPDQFAAFPSALIKPLLRYEAKGIWPFKRAWIYGLNDYKLLSYSSNGQIITKLTIGSSKDVIEYRFYQSGNDAQTALKLLEVDQVYALSAKPDESIYRQYQVDEIKNLNKAVTIVFNTQDPLLEGQSGRNLRIALAYTLDKNKLHSNPIMTGPIQSESWAFSKNSKIYPFDIKKAQEAIKRMEKAPQNITLSTDPDLFDQAEIIKEFWQTLDINVDIKTVQSPEEFQVYLTNINLPNDPDQYSLWHSTQKGTNLSRLNNPRLDKLLEDGRKTIDVKERKKIYEDFQKFFQDEVPAIFLYHPNTYSIRAQKSP